MSIRLNPKVNTWYFRFTRDGRSYFKGGYRTKRQAEDAQVRFFDKLISGEIVPEAQWDDLTFQDGSQWYLQTISPSKDSYPNDKARIPVMQGFFKNKRLKEITPEDVIRFRRFLQAREGRKWDRLAPNTVNHFHRGLKAVFNGLKKHKKFRGENPAEEVKIPVVPKGTPRFLHTTEEQAFTEVIRKNDRLWPYYFVGLHTGMRLGELCNMRVEHVNLDLADIYTPETKNGKRRHIQMSPGLVEYMRPRIVGKGPQEWVLGSYIPNTVCRWFTMTARKLNFPGVTFHSLRHTYVNRLLTIGVPIYIVSKLIGHSSVRVTEDTYGFMARQDLQSAAARIDGTLSLHSACIQQNGENHKIAVNS